MRDDSFKRPPQIHDINQERFRRSGTDNRMATVDLTTSDIPAKYTAAQWREIKKQARNKLHYLLGGTAGD